MPPTSYRICFTPNSHFGGALSLALWSLFCLPAQAVEFKSTVHNTSIYTSNTQRTEDSEIGEWIHEPGIDLSAKEESASWSLDADYRFLRRLYQGDVWDDESVTTGQGKARWQALPERLDFFISSVRREASIRALQAQTRDNRQVISTTRAGSTLSFRPGGRKDALQLEYAYTDRHSTDTQTDSRRHSGTITYTLASSQTSRFQLQTSYSDITYDGIFPDGNTGIATFNYDTHTRKLDLAINVGHNWFDRDGRGSTDDSTYNVVILWRASSSSTVTFNASSAIVDQSTRLTGGTGPINENTGINAAFKEIRGDLSLLQEWGRTRLTLRGYWAKEEYAPDIPLDNDRFGFNIGLSRRLTQNTSVFLDLGFSNRDFKDQGDDQDEFTAKFRINHQIGRTIDFNYGADYIDRESDSIHGFDEWRAVLEIRYTFVGSR